MTKCLRRISEIGRISLLLSAHAGFAAAQTAPAPAPVEQRASTRPTAVAPAQADEPNVLPPPPPGYEYVLAPTVPAEPQEDVSNRLKDVDARLSALRAERRQRSLAGPIAMMASGYGVSLIAGLVALSTFASAEDIQHDDYWGDNRRDYDINDDGDVDRDDEKIYRRLARGFGVLSLVSLGVGVGGGVLFASRARDRGRSLPEIRSLQQERWELRKQLEYSANPTRGGMQLSLSARF